MTSKYFKRSEFKCKCGKCDFDAVDTDLLNALEDVREHFDSPLTINSACRCADHNESIGGAVHSQHVYGKAADIVVRNVPPDDVHAYLDKKYGQTNGLGAYDDFTHFDVRTDKARWDKRHV